MALALQWAQRLAPASQEVVKLLPGARGSSHDQTIRGLEWRSILMQKSGLMAGGGAC